VRLGQSRTKKKGEDMVKVTIESDQGTQVAEGECVVMFMEGANDGRKSPEGYAKAAVALVGRHEDPRIFMPRVARSLGLLVKEFYDDPFKRLEVAMLASKRLMGAIDDENVEVIEKKKYTERVEE
jgi:hypothetical protein